MDRSHVVFGNHSLRSVASESGPFVTIYLRPGPDLADRLETLLSAAPVDLERVTAALSEASPQENTLATDDDSPAAHCCVVSSENVHLLPMADPIRLDVVRRGSVPSLGALLESIQLVPGHAIVTFAGDELRLTTFGTSTSAGPDSTDSAVVSSLTHLIERLRFLRPAKVAVVGPEVELESILPEIAGALPTQWVDAHYVDESAEATSETIDTLADAILRSAASLGAETITHELGRFRVAATMGLTVDGAEALHALRADAAASVLVHDDVDDERTIDGDRLVDLVVAEAVSRTVRVTMIPNVAPGRGPAGGIGAILSGDVGVDASATQRADLVDTGTTLQLDRPNVSPVKRTIA